MMTESSAAILPFPDSSRLYIPRPRKGKKNRHLLPMCSVLWLWWFFFLYIFLFHPPMDLTPWWFIPATSRTSIVWDGGRRIHHLNRWRHYTQCEFRCSSRSTHHWSRQLHYLRSLMYIFQFLNGSWILKFSVRDYLFIYLLASQFLGVDGWLTFIS